MQQVIINLLSNALKFSKPGDFVDIRLFLTETDNPNEVELKI